MSGSNTALKKITTLSHPESFVSAVRGHIQTSGSNIKEQNQLNRRKTKLLVDGQHTVHIKHLPTPSAALPHPSSVLSPQSTDAIPCEGCSRAHSFPHLQAQANSRGAAAPCPTASHCAEEHQGWTWPGTSATHTCSSHKLTRDLVARSQVYPQGCKSEMLGPAQSQNICLWDIQTAWNRGHRGPIRNSILAL